MKTAMNNKPPLCLWCGKSLAWALCPKRRYCPHPCRDQARIFNNATRLVAKDTAEKGTK